MAVQLVFPLAPAPDKHSGGDATNPSISKFSSRLDMTALAGIDPRELLNRVMNRERLGRY
jgi:hypothetical protein